MHLIKIVRFDKYEGAFLMLSSELSNAEYEQLLAQYEYCFKKGDLIKGLVIGYDSEGAVVDIGAKTAAICRDREAKLNREDNIQDILKKSETYEFLIITDEDENGRFTISYKRVANAYSWKQLEEIKAADKIIEGTVVQVVKGGILVDVMGIRGFVPVSHMRARISEEMTGQTIELKILNIDSSQNQFILSNRKVHEDSLEDIKKDIFEKLEIGQVVRGEVVRITDFGAFIDIGGVDGLLPLSQISWKWVEHPGDVLKPDEKINVEIISIDYDKQRVSLSLKSLEPDPWIEAKGSIQEGAVVSGKIVRIKHFGAFVEVCPSVEALLPNDELAKYQNKNETILGAGDFIDVVILKFNPDDKRISLGIRE